MFTIYAGFITASGIVTDGYTCTCGAEIFAGHAGTASTFRAQHMQAHLRAGEGARFGGKVLRGCPKCGELSNTVHWTTECERAWASAYEAVSQPA